MKKSHPIRHRKLASRRQEADRARAIRTVRFTQAYHSARRYLEQFYRRSAIDEARLRRWGGPTFTPPAFGGGAYMAPAASRMMGERA